MENGGASPPPPHTHTQTLLCLGRREVVTVRGRSYFSRLPKYWPPSPSPPGESVLPRNKGGGYTLGEGSGGSIFWKTREIGLPSYNNNLSTAWGIRNKWCKDDFALVSLFLHAVFCGGGPKWQPLSTEDLVRCDAGMGNFSLVPYMQVYWYLFCTFAMKIWMCTK